MFPFDLRWMSWMSEIVMFQLKQTNIKPTWWLSNDTTSLCVSVNLWHFSLHLFQVLIPVCCALWLRECSMVTPWVTATCFQRRTLKSLEQIWLWSDTWECVASVQVSIPSRCIPKISSCHSNSCITASCLRFMQLILTLTHPLRKKKQLNMILAFCHHHLHISQPHLPHS